MSWVSRRIAPKQTEARANHVHQPGKTTMTIAYWCILIAALLPYAWVAIAKAGPRYDNRDPRAWMAKQDNPRAHRAYSAQLNAFEAFAPFAAGVLMAQFAGVDPQRIAWLAIAFIALRRAACSDADASRRIPNTEPSR